MEPLAGIGLAILLLIIAVVVIVGTWASRYQKVGPEEVLIISGRRRVLTTATGTQEVGFRIVRNGGTFVWPVIEKIGRMSLRVIDTEVQTQNAMSKEGVPLEVAGTALFKIASSDEGIANAAERYMGVEVEEIRQDVKMVLEGHLRGVCGTLTPEEIYRDRAAFQAQIAEQAQADLRQLGIVLDTLTLRDIRDSQGYLDALGKKRTEEVRRDARIGVAIADREANVAEAENRQYSEVEQAKADANIAAAQRDLEVKKAEYESMIAAERSRAAQAGPLAQAKAEQQVTAEQTHLAEERARRREAELLSEIVKPAIADREAVELRATAEQSRLGREGEGEAARIRAIGEAEASAIGAKLIAEAEGLQKKAEAMAAFNEASMSLQIATELIHVLPEMIQAAVQPLSHVDEIRIVDFGGGNSNGDGANAGPLSKLLNVSPQAMASVDETLRQTLGTSLTEMIALIRSGKPVPLSRTETTETARRAAQRPRTSPAGAAEEPEG